MSPIMTYKTPLQTLRSRMDNIIRNNGDVLQLLELQEQYNRVIHSFKAYNGQDPAE